MPKIYTRTGDQGTTGLISGRISKADPRLEAIGQLDSLNAQIGYLIDLIRELGTDEFSDCIAFLVANQNLIFTLGSQLADVEGKCKVIPLDQEDVSALEMKIDQMTESLSPLRNFILPGGHPLVSWTHVVRATCRSAERACVDIENLPEKLLPYLNRFSDYFFTLARYLAKVLVVEEIIWQGKRTYTTA